MVTGIMTYGFATSMPDVETSASVKHQVDYVELGCSFSVKVN